MGKKMCAAVCLLLFGLLFGKISSPAAEDDGPPVSMEVSSVYDGVGKMGEHIPLTIRLYGQSAKPFTGTVAVKALENGMDSSEEVFEYGYSVSVNTAETKKLEIYVPLGQRSPELLVTLKDHTGKEIAEKTMSFDVSRDKGRLLVGILSERDEELLYLDGISMDYGMVNSVVLSMDESSFPTDSRGLELLDLLIVNHFDTGKLLAGQREAVLKWVDNGGILLLGTGGMAGETLNAFAGEIPGLTISDIRLENVALGTEYDEKAPGDSNVEMVCADVWFPGGDAVMESDGQALLTMKTRGKGKIGIFSYDLGNLREFVERNPAYGVRMLTEAVGAENISNLYFYSSYGTDREYWNAQNLVNTGSADRLPNLPLYTAAAVCYLLAAGPGLYLILKRRELSRYYGFSVVVAAVIASAVIYILGAETRFTSEFYTCVTVMDVGEDSLEETSYLNIRTPDSRPFSAKLSGDYAVTPLTRSSRYEDAPVLEFNKKKGTDVGVRYGEEEITLSAGRSRAFEPRFFKLERQLEKNFEGGFSGDLTWYDGFVSGYVSNDFPFPLTDAALVFYGQIYPLGTLEAGEIRELNKERLLAWPVGMPYIVSSWLSGSQKVEDGDDGEYLRSVGKESLYSYYLERYFGSGASGGRIVGFGPENGLWEPVSREGQEADSRVLYTAALSLTSGQNGRVYRSGLADSPNVTANGAFYADGTAMYGTEPVVVEYFLGEDIQVEQLSFFPVAEEFLNSTIFYYLKQFDGEAYFYNYNTKAYDRAELLKKHFLAAELEPYLSPENTLVVKYTIEETDSAGVSSLLPVLMVTGRVR